MLPDAPPNANGTVHPSSPVYPPRCTPSACVACVCTALQPCRSRHMVRLPVSVCPDLPLIVRRAGVMHRERTAHSHCYAIDQQYPPVCLLALGPMPCCPARVHGTRGRPRTHAAPYPGTHASSGCQPHCRGIRTRPPHCTSTSSPAVFNVTHCLHWGCSSSPSVRGGRHIVVACALTLTHAGCAAGQLRGAAAAYLPEEHAAAARHAETAVAPTTRTHSHLLAPACHASHNCFLACTSIARAWASTSTSLPLPCRPCTSRTSKPVHVCSCNLLGHLEARTHSTFLQCLISACRQAGRSHISGHWTGGCAPAM